MENWDDWGMLGNSLWEKQGISFDYGKASLEDRSQLLSDMVGINPTHVFNARRSNRHVQCELAWREFNKLETIRSNVAGVLSLANVWEENGVLLLHFGRGCIYNYDSEHPMGSGVGFTEEDKSNYAGSFYSKTKGMVHSNFTFAANPNFLENDIRVKPNLDALGALGDAGWYCIMSILLAADFELPKYVIALRNPVFNKSGVIIACGASLYWEDGTLATFQCSFLSNMTMDVTAIGTNGYLYLHGFVIPYDENKASYMTGTKSGLTELLAKWDPKPSEHIVSTDIPQEVVMVKEFSRLVASIKNNGSKPEKRWLTFSRKTQLVLDAVKTSIEKGFEPIEIVS